VPLDTPPPKTEDPEDPGSPSAERQMRIYKAERPRRRRRWSVKRIVLITLAVLLLLVAALAGAVAWWANGVYGQISNVTPDMKRAQKELDTMPPLPDQPTTALVIGTDHRGTDPKSDPGLSDTLMLVRMDPRAATSRCSPSRATCRSTSPASGSRRSTPPTPTAAPSWRWRWSRR